MFSKLRSNYRNLRNRTKDNIFKMTCLIVVLMIWAIVVSLVFNNYATAAAVDEIIPDDEVVNEAETSMPEQPVVETEKPSGDTDISALSGETTPIESDSESDSNGGLISETLDELNEISDVFSDYMTSVADFYLGSDDGDYSGAPSDIPPEALSRPETEAQSETEVLNELKVVDFSSYPYDYDQAVALAQLAWAEGRGLSMREQSLVMWTVLNRIDVCYDGCGDFWSVLTAPYQFAYYTSSPYEEYELRIAIDVLQRYAAEKDGVEDVGRTLPQGYLYYWGDGCHNYFGMNGFGNELWFGLGDPYETW